MVHGLKVLAIFMTLLIVAIPQAALMGMIAQPAAAQGWDPREPEDKKSALMKKSTEAMNAFLKNDPTLEAYFKKAYGYAVFPSITKAGALIGGARGKGVVYKAGSPVLKAYLSQYTVGLQLGGKKYREIIFFRDQAAYDAFVDDEFEFSAQATAVIASEGAGQTASYDEGVAVFVLDKTGAMVEASLGGQEFKIRPLK